MKNADSGFFSAFSSKAIEMASSVSSKTKEMAASASSKASEVLKNVQETAFRKKEEDSSESHGSLIKRAVLVGVSYANTNSGHKTLPQSINSAEAMKDLLCKHFGYLEQNVVILRDDGKENGPTFTATRPNILTACSWLVSDLRPGTCMFFYFCGHGSQDGIASAEGGKVYGHELHRILVNPLPPSVVLHSFVDACHSGSLLGLPYFTDYDFNQQQYIWRSKPTHWGSRPSMNGTRGGIAIHIGSCLDQELSYLGETRSLIGTRNFNSRGLATHAFIQAIEQNRIGAFLKVTPNQVSYGGLLAFMMEALSKQDAPQLQGGALVGVSYAASFAGSMLAGPAGGLAASLTATNASGSNQAPQHPVISANQSIDLFLPLLIGGIP